MRERCDAQLVHTAKGLNSSMGMCDLNQPGDRAFHGATGHTGSELSIRGLSNGKS
jgi:hypothetical protein